MDLIVFLLASYGVTNIVTSGKIFERLREWVDRRSSIVGYWLHCPMCMGLWVGVSLSIAGLGAVSGIGKIRQDIISGFVASGWCWMVRVVMSRLGEDEL